MIMKKDNKIQIFWLMFIFVISCKDENPAITYYENGQVKEIIDIEENTIREFYKNGKFKLFSGYKNNKLNGKINHFYESGVIKDSGYFYNGEPLGLSYFYNEEGFLTKIGEYLFIEGEGSILNEIVYFNENGDTIRDKGHSYAVNFALDSVNYGDEFRFSIIVENSIFNDSLWIQVGKFDSLYNIQDTSTLRSFFGKIPSVSCKIKYLDKGRNIIRGIIEDYTVNDTITLSRPLYFSFPVYVK